jgi:exoribonuclease R
MGIRAIEGGYLRATSPLRRYTDLVAHWQIKSTLDPANPSKPPFSRTDVEAMLYQTERTTALRRRAEARAVQFWKLYTVDKKWKDALVDPTRDPAAAELLLNSLTAIVRNVKPDSLLLRMVANVQVPELGVAAVLQTSPQTRLEVDQRVRVDITGVILDEYSKLYLKLKQ